MALAAGIVQCIYMAQGGAHIPAAPGSPAKPSTAKAAVPARAPSSGTMGVARPQSPPAPAAKPAAPAAPKAQPRPAPAPVPAVKPVAVVVAKAVAVAPAKPVAVTPAKPVAVAPAPPVQRAAPTPVENSDTMETRVGPAPVAAVKPLQQAIPQSQQDLRPVVRAMVDASVALLEEKVRDLQRRVEELELRRPPALAAASTHAYATAHAAAHPATRAPVLDIATIERTVQLGPEAASFDGTRRRRRLFVATVVGIVVVFGGLFAALAQSYTHAHP
jgi:hypothetical protein